VFQRILVVCTGNICRSPMAASLLRRHLPQRADGIGSAGLAALVDHPIDPLAGEVLAAHGFDAAAHRARQATRDTLLASDLVLAMDAGHLARMQALAPEATGRIFLLDKWIDSRDVPDPYRQPREVFERVYGMIEQGVRGWLPHLR
jgi:protein-tyrosine phosphatase